MFFADESEEKQVGRQCAPLRRSGDRYSFLHKSLQEYLAARHIAKQLNELVAEADLARMMQQQQQAASGTTASINPFGDDINNIIKQLHIAQKLLNDDVAVLRFVADLVDTRIWQYKLAAVDKHPNEPEQYQPLGRALWDLIELSKRAELDDENNLMRCAAANAMSVLNAAGVGFSGRDLSGIRVGPRSSSSRSITQLVRSRHANHSPSHPNHIFALLKLFACWIG